MSADADAVVLTGDELTVRDVVQVARGAAPVRLAPAARERLAASRRVVEALVERDEPVYGVNTGFGELASERIPHERVAELQRNLVRSHACGQGDPLPPEVVRAVLVIKANGLAKGLSGVRPRVVDHLLALLDHDVVPRVPQVGSLGASGDLIPLAHVAQVLTGEGEAFVDGERLPGAGALQRAGLEPLELQAKEGLALINGTEVMGGLLCLAVQDGWNLVRSAETAAALSIEVLLASVAPLDPRLHAARPHHGQGETAANLRRLTEGSGLVASHADCDRVQDAYTLRCVPQVLGAVRTALAHARDVLEVEINSATDNPLVFPGGDAVSGGNFHGETLALVAGYLAQALSEVGAFSERRIARLVDRHLSEGLPAFLSPHPGLHSGLMLPHYVAAAYASENKTLAAPAAVDSLPVSANQEDHVSNGALAARRVREILGNAEAIVAVELATAAQAADLRDPVLAPATAAVHRAIRGATAHLEEDRSLAADLERVKDLVHRGAIVDAARSVVGELA